VEIGSIILIIIGGLLGYGVGWAKVHWSNLRNFEAVVKENRHLTRIISEYFERIIGWDMKGRKGDLPHPGQDLLFRINDYWDRELSKTKERKNGERS
jgi:hypothetical protein